MPLELPKNTREEGTFEIEVAQPPDRRAYGKRRENNRNEIRFNLDYLI